MKLILQYIINLIIIFFSFLQEDFMLINLDYIIIKQIIVVIISLRYQNSLK